MGLGLLFDSLMGKSNLIVLTNYITIMQKRDITQLNVSRIEADGIMTLIREKLCLKSSP